MPSLQSKWQSGPDLNDNIKSAWFNGQVTLNHYRWIYWHLKERMLANQVSSVRSSTVGTEYEHWYSLPTKRQHSIEHHTHRLEDIFFHTLDLNILLFVPFVLSHFASQSCDATATSVHLSKDYRTTMSDQAPLTSVGQKRVGKVCAQKTPFLSSGLSIS